MSNNELATAYAAIILADNGEEITSSKLDTLLSAAGLSVEPFWTSTFAKALQGKDVKDLLSNVGAGGGGAPAAGGAAPAAAAGGGAVEEKVEEKEEEKEESDDDMGFGLFD